MEKNERIIKKRKVFVVTRGIYSDYELYLVCRALVDIDIDGLKEEYFQEYPKQKEEYEFSFERFVAWLIINKKVCEELDYYEWHVGSYSKANFSLDFHEIASEG